MRLGCSRRSLLSLLLVAGCGGAPREAGPPLDPPPPYAETLPLPPVTEEQLIWQPGHWDWTGVGYTWRDGRYVPQAGHGTQWQPGYWAHGEDGVWRWVPAHWL